MNPPESSELENSSRVGNHFEDWLSSAFERWHRPLVAYAWRLLNGDTEQAQDCVQDTFMALCKQPRSSVEDHLEAWLFKTCRNRTIDIHRRRKAMISTSSSVQLEYQSGDQPEPSAVLEQSEEQTRVESAIRELPEREQELLSLRLTHELSYKQIAEITGLSISNVGYLLHQSMTRLRNSLSVVQS